MLQRPNDAPLSLSLVLVIAQDHQRPETINSRYSKFTHGRTCCGVASGCKMWTNTLSAACRAVLHQFMHRDVKIPRTSKVKPPRTATLPISISIDNDTKQRLGHLVNGFVKRATIYSWNAEAKTCGRCALESFQSYVLGCLYNIPRSIETSGRDDAVQRKEPLQNDGT